MEWWLTLHTLVGGQTPDKARWVLDAWTETWLSPPVGNYDLKLELLDNLNPGQTLTAAVNTSVTVR